ncbi:uncharacterized protein LOC122427586 isoform X4 [Cervus canadensis]|uniref:uncharacterized protein LOC122427586 isoform X4 n=1 Tax=Cervus canadensis TaxID=1574408 RepID=UPI001CA38129|nr:uncharacterized protein LOC122427586 isoform X4 [Cervus canadensis]XP_043303098.1 uncharacterized protein LOC122427586 isoform X4 [Cervus canadensis]XP_043303099.1 uncharacterized protein LOC122427586 isoform X4 [Cervus canadensis]
MATYPPRRLLGARPLPSDPRRDPRRSDFPPGGGGRPRNLRCLRARFEGPAARHHHFLRRKFKKEQILGPSLPFPSLFPPQFLPASSAFSSTM